MKGNTKLLAIVACAAGSLLSAGGAFAAPIAAGSELSLNGSDTFNSTSITFMNPANVGGTSGSFNELPLCDNCATFIGSLSAGSGGTLYTVTDAGNSSTLVLSPPSSFVFSDGVLPSLTISGAGTLTLTGFDATAGIFEITTQGPAATVTFSVTSVAQGQAVPEPASLAILGSALAGLGMIGRRRRKLYKEGSC